MFYIEYINNTKQFWLAEGGGGRGARALHRNLISLNSRSLRRFCAQRNRPVCFDCLSELPSLLHTFRRSQGKNPAGVHCVLFNKVQNSTPKIESSAFYYIVGEGVLICAGAFVQRGGGSPEPTPRSIMPITHFLAWKEQRALGRGEGHRDKEHSDCP